MHGTATISCCLSCSLLACCMAVHADCDCCHSLLLLHLLLSVLEAT